MKKIFIISIALSLLLVTLRCGSQSESTIEEDQQELTTLKQTIEALAASSVCNNTYECKFIAMGSKPCGGPWSYLIYSSSINEDQLKSLVINYNKKEAAYNQKWGIVSDCAVVSPPTSIACENNTCIAIY